MRGFSELTKRACTLLNIEKELERVQPERCSVQNPRFYFPPSWYSEVYWWHVLDVVSPVRGSLVRRWHRTVLASGVSLSELSPLLSFKNAL